MGNVKLSVLLSAMDVASLAKQFVVLYNYGRLLLICLLFLSKSGLIYDCEAMDLFFVEIS